METGRGKKGKKAGWHLSLGLKDVIFAGIGIVGLMMMSFTLGALAGRGDIYRAAYSWGLLSPEAKTTAQIAPQAAVTPVAAPAPAPAAAPTPAPKTAAAPSTPPAPTSLASLPGGPAAPAATSKGVHHTPIAGSMAPLPPPAAAASSKKKAKAAAQAQRERKAREQLRERQEVASKLTFLNSFDSGPKISHKKDKTAAKSQPTQVKVGTYRDSKTAQAKLAELKKQGIKATLKQGKDAKGAIYTVYRQAPAHPKESENMAQKKEKTVGHGPSR